MECLTEVPGVTGEGPLAAPPPPLRATPRLPLPLPLSSSLSEDKDRSGGLNTVQWPFELPSARSLLSSGVCSKLLPADRNSQKSAP